MNGARVIYIVGLSHSGSTVLSMLLGSHPQALAVGELKALSVHRKMLRKQKNGIQRDILENRCSCGVMPMRECPFWQQVETILRERIGLGLDEIDLSVSDVNHFRQHSQALYAAIYQVAGEREIVDSSKDIFLLHRLLRESELAVRPLLVVRRMEGVVASNMHKGRRWLPSLVKDALALAEMRYRLRGIEHLVIRYEELATSPDAVLRTIWTWLDMPFYEEWPQWTETEHHLFAGNRMRENPNPQIRIDDAWQHELTWMQKLVCRWVDALSATFVFQRVIMLWKARPKLR